MGKYKINPFTGLVDIAVGSSLNINTIDVEDPNLELLKLKRTGVFDKVWRYFSVLTPTWTDYTDTCSRTDDTYTGDILDAVGDYFYMGKSAKFLNIYFDIRTATSSGATFGFEYSDGAGGWLPLTVTDGTTGLTTSDGVVTFADPGNWLADTVNGTANLFWVRIKVASGTFVTEPTLYQCTPTSGNSVMEVYAAGSNIYPDFCVDRNGVILQGYAPGSASLDYGIRTNKSIYCLNTLVCGLLQAGSSAGHYITTSNSIRDYIGYPTLRVYSSAVTAAQIADIISVRLETTAWDTSGTPASKVNAWDLLVLPQSRSITSSRFMLRVITANGVADGREVFNVKDTGVANLMGGSFGSEVLNCSTMDGACWTSTGDFAYTTNDYTLTYATGAGTLTQLSTDFLLPLKPNTWYRAHYVIGVAGPATTLMWLGSEVADDLIYLTTGVAGTYDTFFKTNSAPGNLVLYATASATSGLRIDSFSVKEAIGGELYVSGKIGIGTSNRTANLHVQEGSTVAGTAPIKVNAGATLTVVEPGAIEFDGTDFYVTLEG
jgi:hypothetical protein